MVNAQSHPELLWALRGAASAYGVVTNMVLQLHDVSNFYGGFIMWQDDPEHSNWRYDPKFLDCIFESMCCISMKQAAL